MFVCAVMLIQITKSSSSVTLFPFIAENISTITSASSLSVFCAYWWCLSRYGEYPCIHSSSISTLTLKAYPGFENPYKKHLRNPRFMGIRIQKLLPNRSWNRPHSWIKSVTPVCVGLADQIIGRWLHSPWVIDVCLPTFGRICLTCSLIGWSSQTGSKRIYQGAGTSV